MSASQNLLTDPALAAVSEPAAPDPWRQSLPVQAPSLADLLGEGQRDPSEDADCIPTHAHGCLSPEEFETVRDELARDLLHTPEFQSEGQWGLRRINAHEAHATLSLLHGPDVQPGAGVDVAVVDSGIDLEHRAFREGAQHGSVRETHFEWPSRAPEETGEEGSHGTSVASIVAGASEGEHTGVAPGVDLKMTAVDFDTQFERIPDILDEALLDEPDVMNMSFGIPRQLAEHYDEATLRDSFWDTIDVMAQTDRTEKSILVWSAGNDHGKQCAPGTPNCVTQVHQDGPGPHQQTHRFDASSPSVDGGLVAHVEELRDHSIVVVAIGEDGKIADFSNRCGMAAQWCIAAPGEQVQAAYFGPFDGETARGYQEADGTSFAAPMVTGALALMKQRFGDQLSNTELVARLFETADKSGVYADRDTYGQGVLDLGAALAPLGGDVKVTTQGNGPRVRDAQPRSVSVDASVSAEAPQSGADAQAHDGASVPTEEHVPVAPKQAPQSRPDVAPRSSGVTGDRLAPSASRHVAPESGAETGPGREGVDPDAADPAGLGTAMRRGLAAGRGYLQQVTSSLRGRPGSSGASPDAGAQSPSGERDAAHRESSGRDRRGERESGRERRGAGGIGVRRTGPATGFEPVRADPVSGRARAGGVGR